MSSKKVIKPVVSAAAERNKEPIALALQSIFKEYFGNLPFQEQQQQQQNEQYVLKCLEIGSGVGQHLAFFSMCFPGIQFQPSDKCPKVFDSINALRGIKCNGCNCQSKNMSEPILLDLRWPKNKWPIQKESFDIVYCSNVIHISPWKCSIGLFQMASFCLKSSIPTPTTITTSTNSTANDGTGGGTGVGTGGDGGGLLIIYGPMSIDGKLEPQSNIDFDAELRKLNPEWGVRDTKQLKELADKNQLKFVKMIDMPANNKILLFQKIHSNRIITRSMVRKMVDVDGKK